MDVLNLSNICQDIILSENLPTDRQQLLYSLLTHDREQYIQTYISQLNIQHGGRSSPTNTP